MAEQIGKNTAEFNWDQVKWIMEWPNGKFDPNANADRELAIKGVATDSRTVEKGNLFVAINGEKFDGHSYVSQARAQGAVAAIVERKVEVDIPQYVVPNSVEALGKLARIHHQTVELLNTVAVTGSYGKTSTRALIFAALSGHFRALTSQANFNNEIGLPMTLFQLTRSHQVAVLEMGMRGAQQIDYLAKIAEPTVGVITNVGPQHIELLGSLENIARAKAELIENLPADGLAILPADSPFLPMLKGKAPCRFVTFGLARDADYRVENVRTDDPHFLYFDLHYDGKVQRRIALPMIGAHNAINAAAALAVAHQLGIEIADAERYLENAELPGARMRVIQTESLTIIDDCYNAGPDSMRAALETLRDFPGDGRRVAVLGAMRELGAFSDDEHRKLGELAGEICDFVVGVGPETEPMMETLRASGHQLFGWSPDATAATSVVSARLQSGDIVLVKGSRSVGLEIVVEELQKSA